MAPGASTDPDDVLEEMLGRLAAAPVPSSPGVVRHMRRACPAKGCYEEQGHDENVHGIRMPTMMNRSQRRGNSQTGRRQHRRS